MKKIIILCFPALIALACGGGVQPPGGEGGQGGVSATVSTSSSTGTGGTGGVDTCDSADACGSDQYCSSFLWSCGELYGECKPRPDKCSPAIEPACGCDGKVYDNDCAAFTAGVDISRKGCTAPAGTFACGYTFCQNGAEWCRERFEAGWYCEPLPAECKAAGADCTCFGFKDDGTGAGKGDAANCNQCAQTDGQFLLKCG